MAVEKSGNKSKVFESMYNTNNQIQTHRIYFSCPDSDALFNFQMRSHRRFWIETTCYIANEYQKEGETFIFPISWFIIIVVYTFFYFGFKNLFS